MFYDIGTLRGDHLTTQLKHSWLDFLVQNISEILISNENVRAILAKESHSYKSITYTMVNCILQRRIIFFLFIEMHLFIKDPSSRLM